MLDRHDSKFTIRRVKRSHVIEFSRMIIDFIHDNIRYMKANIKCVLQAKSYNGKNYPTPRAY
jgi:hypothetical protein